ncbi:Flp pilus assembly complex ATPase component TadA [Leptolyngbya sp. 15MV]|nr:Flp pilus assembly complex ATPase component TadA [Leptolyngbya sp. 15MV]
MTEDVFADLRVKAVQRIAEDIVRFELVHPDGAALPPFTAGAHLKVRAPNGAVRRYSLCSDPADEGRCAIAVKREATGQGGSVAMCDGVKAGDLLPCTAPRNDFALTGRPAGRLLILAHTAAPAPVSGSLGDMLIAQSIVSPQQVATALGIIKQTPGRKLQDVLIEAGADEAAVLKAVAEHAGLPFERIDLAKGLDGGFDGTLIQRLGLEFCKQHHVIPLRTERSRVVVGATRPADVFLADEVRARLGVAGVKLAIVTPGDLRHALELLGASSQPAGDEVDVSEILSSVEVTEGDVQIEKESDKAVDLEKQSDSAPVIRLVNHIIHQAVKDGASDIHIEPAEKKVKVRFRIDGELFHSMEAPAIMAAPIAARIKIMANLDISEKRVPQDGRIRCTVQSRKLDLRVSTLPVNAGEKIVMRILDTKSINVQLENLGFHEDTLAVWKKLIDAPHGIVLVTGPTGSGKTTTLYSSLRQLDKNSMNISTVEDPVEYHLDGITQTQVHEKAGMTFSVALRALLRQDPDVIMLGEIRDMETAVIAVQAALTGHLVLSTLHTNDAPSSITRLVNIGLEPFLVGAAVNGVLAQRLVRKLCTHCKTMEPPQEEMREFMQMQGLDADLMPVAKGCDRCRHTGFSGRVGIYELLTVDDQLRDVIARNPNVAEFRRMCIERGMVALRGDGMRKVSQGLTTVQEILRVIGMTLNAGAYLTEIERAGFASVPQAELDAAETMGFSRAQTVWHVIAPHVVRALYPALSNHYIIMTLGTSMAAIFGVEELTGRALNANAISFRSVEIFSVVAGIYILLTIVASALLWLVGRWLFRIRAKVF